MRSAELVFWRFWDEAGALMRSVSALALGALIAATSLTALVVPSATAWPPSGPVTTPTSSEPIGFWDECERPVEWQIVEGSASDRRVWVLDAFSLIEEQTGLTFEESDDVAHSGERLIRIHFVSTSAAPIADEQLLGVAQMRSSLSGAFRSGDVFVGVDAPNTDAATITLHELGHAVGLPHSPDPRAVMFESHRQPHAEFSGADAELFESLRSKHGCDP